MNEPAESPPSDDTPDGPPAERRSPGERRTGDRRQRDLPVAHDRRSGTDRRRGERRRGAGPIMLDADEQDFVNAFQRWRERHGGRFPSAKDLLAMLGDLGWERTGREERA